VQTPFAKDRRLVFSAAKEAPLDDVDAWWLGFELLSMADRELRDADTILRDTGKRPFAVDAVEGANDPGRLRRHFPTLGWEPIPTRIQISDVAGLVQNLGGQGLYGANPRVPLRELIQNARDAVVGRRIQEGRPKRWGEITVRLISADSGHEIEVWDTGLGMSAELLAGPFLDFGTSYWNSALMLREHPGLASSGFEPEGRFGIGFFSVFMWGDHVKVVTRRPEDTIEWTRVLEFHQGISGRRILRYASVDERLNDPGTSVRIRLGHPVADPGGLLAPGPIESRFGFAEVPHRRQPWGLKDLCEWLCPAIDVDLVVEQGSKCRVAVTASDWETMDGPKLLRRLLLHRDDVEEITASESLLRAAANLRDIRDEPGRLLGRAALRSFLIGGSLRDPLAQASAATSGSFRALEQIEIVGLLLGRPDRVSRMMARPSAFDCPEALSSWATEQAALVPELTDEPAALVHNAGLLRLLGGDVRDLPIARTARGICSFDDIAGWKDLPEEILLYEEHLGGLGLKELPQNGIAVISGRMRKLFDYTPEDDPRQRADHQRWKQYWMSPWGAAIEAIALAWGVPLQHVLEVSEISSSRFDDSGAEEPPKIIWDKIDRIRNPRGIGASVKTSQAV